MARFVFGENSTTNPPISLGKMIEILVRLRDEFSVPESATVNIDGVGSAVVVEMATSMLGNKLTILDHNPVGMLGNKLTILDHNPVGARPVHQDGEPVVRDVQGAHSQLGRASLFIKADGEL